MGPFLRQEGRGKHSPSPGRFAKADAYRCPVLFTRTSPTSGFLVSGNTHWSELVFREFLSSHKSQAHSHHPLARRAMMSIVSDEQSAHDNTAPDSTNSKCR